MQSSKASPQSLCPRVQLKMNAKAFEVDLMKSWFKDWPKEGFKSMVDVDPCFCLVHCSFYSIVNCLDDFFFCFALIFNHLS